MLPVGWKAFTGSVEGVDKLAGRPKKRIDYSGWSVDIFSNDTKIDKLLDAQGWAGIRSVFLPLPDGVRRRRILL